MAFETFFVFENYPDDAMRREVTGELLERERRKEAADMRRERDAHFARLDQQRSRQLPREP